MTINTSLAFVFPGQGSQQVGMLAEAAAQWPQIGQCFAEASEVLGFDLWQLIQQGPQDTLNLTENAQPALLTASVALWRLLQQSGSWRQPAYLAGHSLGEWSALVCAGVVDFCDAVRLVQLRGRYMQQAVPVGEGGMAAIIGLADDAILAACAQAAQGQVVDAVNFNSPGQVVIAGHTAAVERAMALCKTAGAKRALPLPVSAPFHTELMRPAADRLALDIAATEFRTPIIPVVHNVHGLTERDAGAIKALMVQQIYSPVRWVQSVEAMASAGVTEVVECGPGRVLGGLIKRIAKDVSVAATDTPDALAALLN